MKLHTKKVSKSDFKVNFLCQESFESSYFFPLKNTSLEVKNFLEPAMFCLLAVLI